MGQTLFVAEPEGIRMWIGTAPALQTSFHRTVLLRPGGLNQQLKLSHTAAVGRFFYLNLSKCFSKNTVSLDVLYEVKKSWQDLFYMKRYFGKSCI
jgi:hypothetical protein